jgi:hypothetical protein
LLLAIATEVTVLAVIALVWRDEVVEESRRESPLRQRNARLLPAGPHFRMGERNRRELSEKAETGAGRNAERE